MVLPHLATQTATCTHLKHCHHHRQHRTEEDLGEKLPPGPTEVHPIAIVVPNKLKARNSRQGRLVGFARVVLHNWATQTVPCTLPKYRHRYHHLYAEKNQGDKDPPRPIGLHPTNSATWSKH
jgi:hypothetical protein